jgi:opacity protein-like surface antigen
LTPQFIVVSFIWARVRPAIEEPILGRIAIALVGAFGFWAPAFADSTATPPASTPAASMPPASAPSLPTLALDPQAPSPWAGLYVGSEVTAAFAKGAKPGFGGAGFVGYNHEFSNNLVIGFQGSAGYAPFVFAHSPYRGFDFGEADMKVGYDMGRFMPYVTAGVVLAKPNSFGVPTYTGATDSMNALFGPGGDLRGYGTVGAGFDYAVTDKLTFGMEVRAGAGRGPIFP